jgi:hypothetical protein
MKRKEHLTDINSTPEIIELNEMEKVIMNIEK